MIEEVPLVLALSLSQNAFSLPFTFSVRIIFHSFNFYFFLSSCSSFSSVVVKTFFDNLFLLLLWSTFLLFSYSLHLKHINILSHLHFLKLTRILYHITVTLVAVSSSYLHSRCVSLICAVFISSLSLFSLCQPPHSLPLMHTSFRVHSCNHGLLSNTFLPIYNYLYFHIHTCLSLSHTLYISKM